MPSVSIAVNETARKTWKSLACSFFFSALILQRLGQASLLAFRELAPVSVLALCDLLVLAIHKLLQLAAWMTLIHVWMVLDPYLSSKPPLYRRRSPAFGFLPGLDGPEEGKAVQSSKLRLFPVSQKAMRLAIEA